MDGRVPNSEATTGRTNEAMAIAFFDELEAGAARGRCESSGKVGEKEDGGAERGHVGVASTGEER